MRAVIGVCRFNKEVNCTEKRCAKCGWNPDVAKKRSEKIREEMKKHDG